ncbi:MAG: ABC transporter ATP-binding protein [Rhodobacteraceae bacterium]|nr:ABC transporter ATP-binding protein [Paracoccaceae bacterium]
MVIELGNLNVTFDSGGRAFHAVRDISLKVEEGESFGIVGESGSGKTTVLRALAGLIRSPGRVAGNLTVDEEDLGPQRTRAFRRKVQMVFQDPYGSLHPRHTINQVVGEGAHVQNLDNVGERVTDALIAVGLDPSFRFRFPHQLSGGQRQRVAIARSLVVEPRILLLDEPTSALDVSVQAEVLNLLVRLRRERKLTYVLVSHDLAVVSHMCDRLNVMQHGRVVETMTVEQLQAGTPRERYTKQLLVASRGYDREAIAQFEEFA